MLLLKCTRDVVFKFVVQVADGQFAKGTESLHITEGFEQPV